ncbi:hypothetical protein KYC5002_43005 [Archangium violaceum]|uniref:hypothetical protein n=1 Tax=Archangium violaceum TaxID=83451 RepID=UPI002B2DAE33|nr:hypothetical protein KYC5002_43005 [Archangium gephyra]
MGIEEREATSRFRETTYRELRKQIDQAARFEVPVEVEWNTLAQEGAASDYEVCWTKVYFEPLIAALEAIASDELGRRMLRSTLKSVVIRNTIGAVYGETMVQFRNGVLTLDHEPLTNVDEVWDRREAMKKALSATQEEEEEGNPLESFLSWKAFGVEAVLQLMQRMTLRQRAGIPIFVPKMSLLLRNGREVSGFLWDIPEGREGRVVLLLDTRERSGAEGNMTFVPVGHIETVTVHDVAAFGAVSRDQCETPSLLQFMRRLVELEAELSGVLETSLTVELAPGMTPTSAGEMRALGFLADRARAVLVALARDKVGQAALNEKVQHIHLRVGDKSQVLLTGSTLELTISRILVEWFTREELETAVRAAL